MSKEFLGIGWKFPVAVEAATLDIAMSAYEQDIKEAIGIILSTAKGERVMRPDFGCGIFNYVFAPMNISTLGGVETSVTEALTLWEPRIQLIAVTTSFDQSDLGKMLVSISYKVRSTNNQFNLVYPFYLNKG
jgi:hypothetical protein